jgi:hypothetical protein
MSVGADGLITDQPALARELVDRHAQLDKPQRLLIALLVRRGKRAEPSPPENELWP